MAFPKSVRLLGLATLFIGAYVLFQLNRSESASHLDLIPIGNSAHGTWYDPNKDSTLLLVSLMALEHGLY